MNFRWPRFHKPEVVADPALVNKLCEQAVEIELLRHQLADTRLHPRRNGRFVNRQDETTERLRSEMQSQNNDGLAEEIDRVRAA